MDMIIDLIKGDFFLLGWVIITIILFLMIIILMIKLSRLNKKYKKFLEKLGKGNNIEEDLETYMYRVEKVERQNAEISNYVKRLDED